MRSFEILRTLMYICTYLTSRGLLHMYLDDVQRQFMYLVDDQRTSMYLALRF